MADISTEQVFTTIVEVIGGNGYLTEVGRGVPLFPEKGDIMQHAVQQAKVSGFLEDGIMAIPSLLDFTTKIFFDTLPTMTNGHTAELYHAVPQKME